MSINEDLWSARMPNGDVRSGTLAQLDEAFRLGHLDASTPVRPSRSDSWLKLADVLAGPAAAPPAGVVESSTPAAKTTDRAPEASVPAPSAEPAASDTSATSTASTAPTTPAAPTAPAAPVAQAAPDTPAQSGPVAQAAPAAHVAPPTAPRPTAPPAAQPAPPRVEASTDVWQAKLANGQVVSGTREQLADAFQAGHLDERVQVLAPGAREWVQLGTVMSRNEPASPPPASADPPAADPSTAEPPTVDPPAVAAAAAATAAIEPAPPAPAPVDDDAATPPQPQGAVADSSAALWQVKLTSRQLDEALRAGLLDANAPVLAAGTDRWVRLGDVRPAV